MKTFKDFLTEGPDDPDWMKVGDPSGLSASERFKANQLTRSEPTAQEQSDRMRAAAEKLKTKASMGREYQQGPAVNDIKVVLERLQKMEMEFDSLASEVVTAEMDPSEIANELDGIRKRMTDVVALLNKAWKHLAISSNKPYRS